SALDRYLRPPLDLLRHDFRQQVGLGEVLRADDDPVVLRTTRQQERHQEHALHRCRQTSLRSTTPSNASASSASSAAGMAPARIRVLSTVATPRKMYTPSPPAPIAAAMVAIPTLTTVAMRTPARMTPAARGSSTSRSSSPSVIPIPRPASRTAGSTPAIPVYVLRTMGRSAYRTSATMAVVAPMPPTNGRGMRNPNNARLGTVWNTFATPSTGPRHAGRRVSRTPSGTPITIAAPVEIATSDRCWPTSPRNSWA